MPWHRAATLSELREGRGWPVRVGGARLALFCYRGEVYALGNICLHNGYPVDDGAVDDGCVTCPWHGWRFELATGDHLVRSPLDEDQVWHRRGLVAYPVRLEGGEVMVEVA